MPLLDHFRPPLRNVLQWNSFHSAWLTALAADFNRELPPRFYAEPSTRFGIEVDVAALERMSDPSAVGDYGDWAPTYSAPAATATVPFAIGTDALEVLVYEDYPGEIRLVGAVEFVSPANKDRPEWRAAFVTKCREYLHRGIGLVIVDVVTDKHFNLHNELMQAIGQPEPAVPGHLYAVAYHPTGKNGSGQLAIWPHPLAVGEPLPELPMWLWGGLSIPARLNDTYDETCRMLRVAARLADRVSDHARNGA
jgi:hypothetical protein